MGTRLRVRAALLCLLVACACAGVRPRRAAPPTDLYVTAGDVTVYPGPPAYVGDVLTLDVAPRNLGMLSPSDVLVQVSRRTAAGEVAIAEGPVGYPAFDPAPRARLVWVWDSDEVVGPGWLAYWEHWYAPAKVDLVVRLDPNDAIQRGDEDEENNVAVVTVRLLPAAARPRAEVGASWAVTSTNCCAIHYLTGTAAERDLVAVVATMEGAVDYVKGQLGLQPSAPLDAYLMDRVIGHGGYATGSFTVSFLDRHYAGNDLEMVVRHEAVHALDMAELGGNAPAMLREGLAVWFSGGHFKPEPLPQRAAALLPLDWYVPLSQLTDYFYLQQHEVAYLEAGAFIGYLVETVGWDRFRDFYTSFESSAKTQTEALDAALAERLGVDLTEAEAGFRLWLEGHAPTEQQSRDLRDTVALFDAVRRYQQLRDPSAYLLNAWLPDPVEAERRGITADLMRRPHDPEDVALEVMLAAAQDDLAAGSYERVEQLVIGVERVLEDKEAFQSPLAGDYLAIVEAVAAAGYEAQRVELVGGEARVWALAGGPDLVELRVRRVGKGWVVAERH